MAEPMLTSLDHIQLAMPPGTEAEDQARAFYAGVLGFTEEPKPWPLSERGGCWFASDTCKLHLGVEEVFAPQLKAHPAFLTDDIDVLARKLEDGGFPVLWDEALPDRKRFYTADSFGNRIEIMRAGDGFSER